MKLKVYTTKGESSELVEVAKEISDVEVNLNLATQVLQKSRANERKAIAHTKNRGEVSGGGRKPWKQKGTGNARAGSNRSPLWIGGGVTFGPRNTRNFSKRLPQKMGALAIQMALADKIKNKKLIVVSSFGFDKIKTSQMQSFLEKLPIEEGKILLVLSKTDPNVELSAANLKYIKTVLVSGLSFSEILLHDYLLTDKTGIDSIQKQFAKKKAAK